MIKYYVRNKEIIKDEWEISTIDSDIADAMLNEHTLNCEYITDRHGKIIGVGYEYE